MVALLRVRAIGSDRSNKSIAPQSVPKEFQRPTEAAAVRASERASAALGTVLEVGVGGGGGDRRQRQQLWAAVDERPRRGVRSISQEERGVNESQFPPSNDKKSELISDRCGSEAKAGQDASVRSGPVGRLRYDGHGVRGRSQRIQR